MGQERLAVGFRRPHQGPVLYPQLLEKWILSEKEWEREKAMNLHLRLMQIYVQSIGVCVSARSPGPPSSPAALPPTERFLFQSVRRRDTFETKSCPAESFGKRLPPLGMTETPSRG